MKEIFEDYKDLYDMYVEQFNSPQMALKIFAKDTAIPLGLACTIHLMMIINKPYEHIWILPHGAILWTETSPETSIAKWIDLDGVYVDYCNGIRNTVRSIEDDIELYIHSFEEINEEIETALKMLIETFDLSFDIY